MTDDHRKKNAICQPSRLAIDANRAPLFDASRQQEKMVLDTLIIVGLVAAFVLIIQWLEGASLLPPNW
jgi:hypothetical protein